MKNLLIGIFLISLLVSLPVISYGKTENPLIEKEIYPIPNPGFEENLKSWGGKPSDNYNSRYTYANTLCKSADIGYKSKKSLSMVLDKYKSSYLPKSFQVKKGKQYYVSAEIKTEGKIHGSIRVVYGASGEPTSSMIGPDSDWKEVGVTFTGTAKGQRRGSNPEISYCELRLRALGKGKVYFDDIRVYELKEYHSFLRVNLEKPGKVKYKIRICVEVGPPKWYFLKYFFNKNGVESGKYSPWINLGKYKEFRGRGIVATGIYFENLKGGKFKKIKAEMDFAYSPDKKAIIKRVIAETPGNIAGVFIPKSESSPFDFVKNFKLLRDDANERNKFVKSLNLPPINLKKYYIEAHLNGFGRFYSDPKIVEKEVNTIREIGFNALDTKYSGLATVYRKAAEKAGIFQTHQTMRIFNLPFDKKTGKYILNWVKIRKNVSEVVEKWIKKLRKEDPEQIALIKYVDIGDEIAGFVFGGKEYKEGYRKYLKEHKITSRFLGQVGWNSIKPYGEWDWRQSWKKRPPRTNIYGDRNFYWTLRYWTYVNARVYRIMTEELEKRLPGITTRVDFGPPWLSGYGSYMRGDEIWEFARRKSVTSMWNEDWLSTYGGRESGIQLTAYLVDLSRSCASVNNLDTDAFVMPAEGEGNIQLKLASVIGKGAKKINIYRYGPAYASPDNWSGNLPMTEGVAKFLRALSKVEGVLFGGTPEKSETAIIWSQSNAIWRETNAPIYDRQLVYLALLDNQIPINFIDEKGIGEGKLKEYKVVYLVSQYLKRSAQKKLAEWVKKGGYLWVDGVGGTGDEYGQKTNIMLPVIGIKDIKLEKSRSKHYSPQYGFPSQKPLGNIIIKKTGKKIKVKGWKVKFSISEPEKTDIIAIYGDGKPAIIIHKYGRGKVYYAGILTGCIYGSGVERKRGEIETGYSPVKRQLITGFALDSGIKRPVTSSVPMVEADLLEGKKGIGLVLANYTGSPVKNLNLKVYTKRKILKVVSDRKGKISFIRKGKFIEFEVPSLKWVDFIILK